MATRQLKALQEKGTHAVGNLNSLKVKTVAHGAICGEDIDNFTMVQLGFNADGEREAMQLAAVANKSYLIASPEVRYMGEEMVDFYNGQGERARIVVPESGYTRFDSSAYSLDAGDSGAGRPAVTAIAKGQVAHFDPASKKFIISDAANAHPDFANADVQLMVVSNEEDIDFTLGAPTVRFEVQ